MSSNTAVEDPRPWVDELDELDDPAVHRSAEAQARYDLERVAGDLTGAYARFIAVTREALVHKYWCVPGIYSPEHWLTCFAGVSRSAATDLVKVASRAEELPCAMAAFENTEITFHQLVVIARHVPAAYEADVTAFAPHSDVGQLRRAVAKYPFKHEGDEEEAASDNPAEGDDTADDGDDSADSDSGDGGEVPVEPDPAVKVAQLRSWFDEDRYHLQFEGPVDQGHLVEQALREAKDALFHATRGTTPTGDDSDADSDGCDGTESVADALRTREGLPAAFGGGLDAAGRPRVTLADALVEAMSRSLRAGTHEVASRADAYRVLFHLDTDRHGWAARSGALPPALAEKLSCDGLLVPILQKNGVPVDVGRTQRIVPRRTRRLVEDRDGGCRFPGCATHRYVEVHHIVHWRNGGDTDLANLVSLCPFHHDRLHGGDFTISLKDERPVFRDQWGESFTRTSRPPARASAAPVKPYERQSWDPLDLNWLNFEPDHPRTE